VENPIVTALGIAFPHSSGALGHLLPIAEKKPAVTLAPFSPSRAESGSPSARLDRRAIRSPAFFVTAETEADVPAREALLDRAMGPRRRNKSSEKLRRGRVPAEGLAFIVRDCNEAVVGTVRLWDGALGDVPALLLGPLAVDPSLKGAGLGSMLMRHAIEEAERLGHRAILLVGDAPYYARFGFSAGKTGALAMPGPYERERFLALELVEGALDGATGVLRPTGRKLADQRMKRAA
jgi:predicted N-acetyltransferase YhbS